MSEVIDLKAEMVEEEEKQQQKEETRPAGKLKVAVLGDTNQAITALTLFNTKKTDVSKFTDVDSLIDWEPNLAFIALETKILSNDTADDKEIIAAVQKICKQTQAGIFLKSLCPPDTIERIQSSLDADSFAKRFAYSPDIHESDDIEKNLNPGILVIGGYEAGKALVSVLDKFTNLMIPKQNVFVCSPMEAAFIKLAISGYTALKQTFFNQLYDAAEDFENLEYNNVRKVFESCNFLSNNTMSIPTWIKVKDVEGLSYKKAKSYGGEYLNRDVKVFAAISDRIPIIDECVNYKNLKED